MLEKIKSNGYPLFNNNLLMLTLTEESIVVTVIYLEPTVYLKSINRIVH